MSGDFCVSANDCRSEIRLGHEPVQGFAYSTNYLIDLDHAVIVDVEATTAIRQAEVGAARTMIERVKDRHNLWPERLAADTAYGSAPIRRLLQHNRRKTDLHSAEVLRTRITSWRAMLEGCIVPAAPSLTETSLPLTNGGPRRTRLLSTATLVPTAQ